MSPWEVSLLFLLTGVVVFMLYILVRKALDLTKSTKQVKETMDDIPYRESLEEEVPMSLPPPTQASGSRNDNLPVSEPASIKEPVQENIQMPEVSGQTEEELKEPEPLQRSVSQKVDEPSNYDKFEKNDNQALFGSNLRHPEAMITKTNGFATLETDVAAQVASSTVKKPESINDLQFNAEMAQNGGEFMKGILAFDNTESGSWFSTI
jgi:hypothetical protein